MSTSATPSDAAAAVSKMGKVVRPVAFIGLGSTGGKIITRLKKFLADNGSGETWTSDFYAFLRITSEISAESGTDTSIPAVPLSTAALTPEDVIHLLNDHSDADVGKAFQAWWLTDGAAGGRAPAARGGAKGKPKREWWVPPVQNFDSGVGGSRPSGRLALHAACLSPDLDNALEGIRTAFTDARNNLPTFLRTTVARDDVDFYIFGMLAGGTCSGSILDLAYLIRNKYPKSYVLSVLLLGDVCYEGASLLEKKPHLEDMQKDNTIHALAELGFAQSPYGRRVLKAEWVKRVGNTSLSADAFTASPFHRVTIVGATNDSGVTLPNFDDYVSFVADYYGALFATEINARQSGRRVDNEAAQVNIIEKDREYRPSTMERIGLLSVAAPRKKLEALAKAHLAIRFVSEHLKNADPARWQKAEDHFKSQISWEALQKHLGPQEPFQHSSPSGVKSKEEFKSLWTDQKSNLEAFYGAWVPKSKSAKKNGKEEAHFESQLKEFEAKWKKALDGCVADLLGEKGDPLSLGSLKALLVTLETLVGKRISELDTRKNELEAKVFGPTGFETAFKNRLEAATAGFPDGKFAFMSRGNFSGGADVLHALENYGKALHELALTQAALIALPALLDHLRVLKIARHAIGKLGAEDLLTSLQKRPDDLFNEVEGGRKIRQEVISDKATIVTALLEPILSKAVDGVSLEEKTRLALASGWAASDTTPAGALRKICEILSPLRDVRTEEKAVGRAEVKKIAEPFRSALESAFDNGSAPMKELAGAIAKLTIWDAIRCYVEQVPVEFDREEAVINSFKAWAEDAGLFPKAEAISAKDAFKKSTHFYYVCDTTEAESCFASLGFTNPGTFLGKVMQDAFGGNPDPLSGAHDQILILRAEVGLLPFFYEGLGADARALLTERSVGDDRSWSDVRFPGWMAGWWKAWGEQQRLLGGKERPAAKRPSSRPARGGRR
jgi:hypothetical protein